MKRLKFLSGTSSHFLLFKIDGQVLNNSIDLLFFAWKLSSKKGSLEFCSFFFFIILKILKDFESLKFYFNT